MHIEIRSRWSDESLFAIETDSWRLAVEAAVQHGADLRGATLYGANLRGTTLSEADLSEATLYGADLSGAKAQNGETLIGERPCIMVGPIGSRADYLIGWITEAGLWCTTGCWAGTLEELRVRIADVHGERLHGREYLAACEYLAVHAQLWTPAATATVSSDGR